MINLIKKKYKSRYSLYLCLAPIFLLIKFGYFYPVIHFLDSDFFTFRFANVTFSLYKLLKLTSVVMLFFGIAQYFQQIAEDNIKKISNLQPVNRAIFTKIFQVLINFFLLLIILDLYGMDLSAFAFLGGAFGIGIGFGLQKVTSNFFSGLIILFEKSIKEGDLIEINTGIYGLIKHTGVRHVLVETFNGQEIMIPNDEFITNRVTNLTHTNPRGRIDIKVGISYESDLEMAQSLVIQAAQQHINCSSYKEPKCYVIEFKDNAIELLLCFWIDNVLEKRIETRSDIMRSILLTFKVNNIEIPFPQCQVHIKKLF